MKAAKKSSIRTAVSSKGKGTVRRKASTHASAKASAKKPAAPGARLRGKIPAVLLEGDAPGTPSPQRRPAAVTSGSQRTKARTAIDSLPEAYGTQRLNLTPRDPHWIHAQWDFTRQQLRDANARSADGHLVLRTFGHSARGTLVTETHVHPESVRWMLHVPQSGTWYAAEIGFYDKHRAWSALAESAPVRTPASGVSTDHGFELATVAAGGSVQRHGANATHGANPPPPNTACALSDGSQTSAGLDAGSSLEATFLSSAAVGMPPSSFGVTSLSSMDVMSSYSSPQGDIGRPPFRLEVNAELIVYGATEPGATLQTGERIIPVEKDGTFRLRYALPDGAHDLPLKATSARTGEERWAELRFARHTETSGQVGAAPQAPGLDPLRSENL